MLKHLRISYLTTMLLADHIFIILFICHLLPFSLGSVVRRDGELQIATEPSLKGTSDSGGTEISSQGLKDHANIEPSLNVASRGLQTSDRDVEVQSDTDISLVVISPVLIFSPGI